MTQTVERMLPLYEAKMIHQFDHRWATYERDGTVRDVTLAEKQDPSFVSLPRYWVREEVVRDRLGDRWDREWLLGWRDICRSTDERTMIASQFPLAAVGHTLPIALTSAEPVLLLSVWSSFVFDYVARQKVGGTHMTYGYLMQLATVVPGTPPPWLGSTVGWFVDRACSSSQRRLGAPTREHECGLNSTPPTSICSASNGRTWTTSWTRSRS